MKYKMIYRLILTYGGSGYINQKYEIVSGTPVQFDYEHDAGWRLLESRRDGASFEKYSYDSNGNRVSAKSGGGPELTALYNDQNFLTRLGSLDYQHDKNGYLSSRGADTFEYSPVGELYSAQVGATSITYGWDGLWRPVIRTVGASSTRYYYGNPADLFQVTHVRYDSGVLFSLYYDDAGYLFALEGGGERYYVATDHLGTPRVVADSKGQVVKILEYDSFGIMVSDSNPAFNLPVGFAGGLSDPVTGLVRFGRRDYEPAAGRWTARDPVFFESDHPNLYVYAKNDPVDFRDPYGLWCVGGAGYAGAGGGFQVCNKGDDWSLCYQVGLGVGKSVEVNPVADTEEPGSDVSGEVKGGCGPAGIKTDFGIDTCGFTGGGFKGYLGPVEYDLENMAANDVGVGNLATTFKKMDCGASANLKYEHCNKW